ncbi:small nuclear ribonucleoprotein-associated protein B'-like [Hyaena hyaena]|uniref:small nuclear ribonucleoprotein-associated protein B'-like n=1 Tax=Hyaena hyaena TaxID=95912 RepID=UPI0019233942|nr:small nuclear ribonucleoprotein-associated protein B'-like [Hyaena hyaena]
MRARGANGGRACTQLSPGSSWNGAWNRSQEGAQVGLLDSYLPSCTQDQKQGRSPSSGQDAGLPWPQSRTGAQRAPNPGDVKLAAGPEQRRRWRRRRGRRRVQDAALRTQLDGAPGSRGPQPPAPPPKPESPRRSEKFRVGPPEGVRGWGGGGAGTGEPG